MIKRIIFISALFTILASGVVYADTAQRTQSVIYVNTDAATPEAVQAMGVVTLHSYNIDGNNYFKLRDIAQILSNNKMGFNVDWDSKQELIKIDTGKPYTSVGNELDYNRNDENIQFTCQPQNTMVSINGKIHEIKTYNIEGNTYFQLRDLGKLIGFIVNWLQNENAIQILSKDKASGWLNKVPEHFTSGGIINTTASGDTYLLEGVIGPEQYQYGNPIPVEQGKHLTFTLNSLSYVSGKAIEEDDAVLRVVFGGNDESSRWGFNFMPNSLYSNPNSFPAGDSANYHITLLNLGAEEVKYSFTVTIINYGS